MQAVLSLLGLLAAASSLWIPYLCVHCPLGSRRSWGGFMLAGLGAGHVGQASLGPLLAFGTSVWPR